MSDRSASRKQLLVVSNRLPVALTLDTQAAQGNEVSVTPGSGGLVSALLPVLRDRGGTWIGWPGLANMEQHEQAIERALARAGRNFGFELQGVPLSESDVHCYYEGFSNSVIWPLFHDAPERCRFEPSYWDCYLKVNTRFAEAVARQLKHDAASATQEAPLVWIHDYQLIAVAQHLRTLAVNAQLAFFLHIPFPPLDIYLRLPWRFQLLRLLLAHDLLGFQTLRDRNNFVQCVKRLLPEVRLVGRGHLIAAHTATAEGSEQVARLGVFPISIDFNTYTRHATKQQVALEVQRLRQSFPQDRQLILGIDRLDYTKGIPERLRAFDALLGTHPELVRKVSFIQVVVPSREDIAEYHSLKNEVERLVSEINGRYTQPGGWVPIQYVYRALSPNELIAFYRCCQIALITPLKDGMNLVAKEFCACSVDEDSVLVLSEFAGAAAQLQSGALMVNPHDIQGVAAALHAAVTMPLADRRTRMRKLRKAIAEQDVFDWVNTFLRAAIDRDLSHFPQPDDYQPSDHPEYSVV